MKHYVIRVDSGLKEIVFEGTQDECFDKWEELDKSEPRERIYIIRDEETYNKNKGGIL